MVKTKEQPEEAPAGETTAATASEAKSSSTKSSNEPITVKYRDHIGNPTERTFSLEVHGPDFAKLADEFKATNASKIIA